MNKTIVECSILQQPMHIMAFTALYYEKDKQQHQRHRQHHSGCQGSIAGNGITESEVLLSLGSAGEGTSITAASAPAAGDPAITASSS